MSCCVNPMLLCAVFLSALLGAPHGAAAKSSPRPPVLTWVFDIHEDREATPRGRVFLRVNGRNVLVVPKAGMQYTLIPRSQYHEKNVPAAALTACSGWWAGAGMDLYVVRRRERLNILLRDLDEQAPDSAYRLIKSIPVRP